MYASPGTLDNMTWHRPISVVSHCRPPPLHCSSVLEGRTLHEVQQLRVKAAKVSHWDLRRKKQSWLVFNAFYFLDKNWFGNSSGRFRPSSKWSAWRGSLSFSCSSLSSSLVATTVPAPLSFTELIAKPNPRLGARSNPFLGLHGAFCWHCWYCHWFCWQFWWKLSSHGWFSLLSL